MNYSPRLAEEAMDTLWTLHEDGALARPIQTYKNLGHSAAVVDFILNPDSYCFPVLSVDRLITPSSATVEQIPVVALEKGTYHKDRPSLHHLQRLALEASGVSKLDILHAKHIFSQINEPVETADGAASTYYNLAPLGKSDEKIVESKPMIILNIDPSRVPAEPICTGVVLHEMVHVSQSLNDPIRTNRFDLKSELEGYAVQAELLSSYDIPYSLSTAMAATVNNFRRKYLGKDTYEPTAEFAAAMAHDNILRKVIKEA